MIDTPKPIKLLAITVIAVAIASCAAEPAVKGFRGDGKVNIKQMHKEARLAYEYGRTGEALFHYQQILKKEPQNISALMASGDIYLKLNEPHRAQAFFQLVLELQPQDLAAREGRALCWLKLGRYEQAADVFRQILNEDKSRWRSYNSLGVISDVKGEYVKATEYYKHALELQPNNVSILNNYGYSLIMSKQYDKAEKVLRNAGYARSERRIVNNLAIALAWQKKYNDALALSSDYQQSHIAYNNVGYIAYLNKDYDVASRYFEKAITLSPKFYKKAEKNLELVKATRR